MRSGWLNITQYLVGNNKCLMSAFCLAALFGALGDLALRKLFPALYQLDRENLLHRDTRVLALARDEGAPAEHLATLEQRLAVPAKEWTTRSGSVSANAST